MFEKPTQPMTVRLSPQIVTPSEHEVRLNFLKFAPKETQPIPVSELDFKSEYQRVKDPSKIKTMDIKMSSIREEYLQKKQQQNKIKSNTRAFNGVRTQRSFAKSPSLLSNFNYSRLASILQSPRQSFRATPGRLSRIGLETTRLIQCEIFEDFIQSNQTNEIIDILLKSPEMRTAQEYNTIHEFMINKVTFFQMLAKEENRSKQFFFQIYEALQICLYPKDTVLCQHGEMGETFFIILDGKIKIKAPMGIKKEFTSYLEVFQYIMLNYDDILLLTDHQSLKIREFIDLIGIQNLKSIQFRSNDEFVEFVDSLLNPEMHPPGRHDIEIKKTKESTKFLSDFVIVLKKIQREKQQKGKIINFTVKGTIFKVVDFQGSSFGEISLMYDKPRTATVTVLSQTATLAILLKPDYTKLLLQTEKEKRSLKILNIRKFDIFKQIGMSKMITLQNYFEEKKFVRGSYLYRQGDTINGLFCIIQGEVQLIKEFWTEENQENIDVNLLLDKKKQRRKKENQEESASSSDQSLILSDQLKRLKSKKITLAYMSALEIVGLDEIIKNKGRRQASLKVSSLQAEVLYIKHSNFLERLYNPYPILKNLVNERVEQKLIFHNGLDFYAQEFMQVNNKPQSLKLIEQNEKTTKFEISRTKKLSENLAQFKGTLQNSIQEKEKVKNSEENYPEKIFAKELVNEQAILTSKIQIELNKSNPNVKILKEHMKKRRQEIALNKDAKIKEHHMLNFGGLQSKSIVGKTTEAQICKILTTTQKLLKKKAFDQKKTDIDQMVSNLVTASSKIADQWRIERDHQEYINKLCEQLTISKKEQEKLKVFEDRLPEFQQYLLAQGDEFLEKLNIHNLKKVYTIERFQNSAKKKVQRKAKVETKRSQSQSYSLSSQRDFCKSSGNQNEQLTLQRVFTRVKKGEKQKKNDKQSIINVFFKWLEQHEHKLNHRIRKAHSIDCRNQKLMIMAQTDQKMRLNSFNAFETSEKKLVSFQSDREMSPSATNRTPLDQMVIERFQPDTYIQSMPISPKVKLWPQQKLSISVQLGNKMSPIKVKHKRSNTQMIQQIITEIAEGQEQSFLIEEDKHNIQSLLLQKQAQQKTLGIFGNRMKSESKVFKIYDPSKLELPNDQTLSQYLSKQQSQFLNPLQNERLNREKSEENDDQENNQPMESISQEQQNFMDQALILYQQIGSRNIFFQKDKAKTQDYKSRQITKYNEMQGPFFSQQTQQNSGQTTLPLDQSKKEFNEQKTNLSWISPLLQLKQESRNKSCNKISYKGAQMFSKNNSMGVKQTLQSIAMQNKMEKNYSQQMGSYQMTYFTTASNRALIPKTKILKAGGTPPSNLKFIGPQTAVSDINFSTDKQTKFKFFDPIEQWLKSSKQIQQVMQKTSMAVQTSDQDSLTPSQNTKTDAFRSQELLTPNTLSNSFYDVQKKNKRVLRLRNRDSLTQINQDVAKLKYTDKVIQSLQLKARTKGTMQSYTSNERDPPLIGTTLIAPKNFKNTNLVRKLPSSSNLVPYQRSQINNQKSDR